MRRYAQGFLAVGLFCFIFPFIAVAPAKNVGFFPMTGWDMVTPQDVGLQKQPPVVMHIPLRVQILLAFLFAVAAFLVMLAKSKHTTWISACATIVAVIALCVTMTSSLPLQITDGQKVLLSVDDPPFQLLPGFYVSLCFMGAAAVSWLFALRGPRAQVAARPVAMPGAFIPGSQPQQASHSFCIKCGGGMAVGARFCNRCGTAVPIPVATAPPAAAPLPAIPRPATAAAAMASSAVASPAPAARPSPQPAPAAAPPQVVVPGFAPPAMPARRFNLAGAIAFATVGIVIATLVWLAVNRTAGVAGAATVSISPMNVRVAPGATISLQALVTGGSNRDVEWSVAEGTSGGSIEPEGATVQNGTVFVQANYRAPLLPGTYHVVAASVADPATKATAQVTVGYPFWQRP